MLILAVAAAAFMLGWLRAARRGGRLADKLQYGVAHMIPAVLVTLLLSGLAWRFGLLDGLA